MMEEYAYSALEKSLKMADEAEIYIETDGEMDVDIQKDKIGFAKEAKSLGLGIRVIVDGKMGFAYTTNLNKLNRAVNQAIANAKANFKDENFAFAPKQEYHKIKKIHDPAAEQLDIDRGIEFAKSLIEFSLEHKCQPTSGGYGVGYSRSILVNSNQVFCENISTIFSASISVNVSDGSAVSTAYESKASRLNDLEIDDIAGKATQIALDSRGGVAAETKDMPVILDHHAAAGLLGTFLMAINGDNVQRGRSIYADKLGAPVAPDYLDVYDDGTIPGGLASSVSDGEGISSKKTHLIAGGVLENFIFDIYTSKKGSVDSTGNGIRSSFSDMPTVAPTNIVFDFKDQYELGNISNGLLVTNVLGAHTANPISGDFSVEVMNAFQVNNGEIRAPVKKAMLSGNLFQALQDIQALTGEKRQIGPFIIPPLLCSSLRVVA